jgi:hypothetical protein
MRLHGKKNSEKRFRKRFAKIFANGPFQEIVQMCKTSKQSGNSKFCQTSQSLPEFLGQGKKKGKKKKLYGSEYGMSIEKQSIP